MELNIKAECEKCIHLKVCKNVSDFKQVAC